MVFWSKFCYGFIYGTDVAAWNFEDGPMIIEQDSDLQTAFHLIEFFLEDLNKTMVQQELLSFIEVHQLFTDLFPPLKTNTRGTERNRPTDTTPNNRKSGCVLGGGGESGRGTRGSNKRGNDTQNSRL